MEKWIKIWSIDSVPAATFTLRKLLIVIQIINLKMIGDVLGLRRTAALLSVVMQYMSPHLIKTPMGETREPIVFFVAK